MAHGMAAAIFTWLLEPRASTIAVALVTVLALPILLHLFLYRSGAAATEPTILVVGPSGAGKTALVSLLAGSKTPITRTSRESYAATVFLPSSVQAASRQYRSSNDPTRKERFSFRMVDTPGHAKLRATALRQVETLSAIRGIIFMVDGVEIGVGGDGLRLTAEYLYQVLLCLQRAMARSQQATKTRSLPLLLAVNKLDLFAAVPPHLARALLERELSELRKTQAQSLLDSAQVAEELDRDREQLGPEGEEPFSFDTLSNLGIEIDVQGGQAAAPGGQDLSAWMQWLARHL